MLVRAAGLYCRLVVISIGPGVAREPGSGARGEGNRGTTDAGDDCTTQHFGAPGIRGAARYPGRYADHRVTRKEGIITPPGKGSRYCNLLYECTEWWGEGERGGGNGRRGERALGDRENGAGLSALCAH